MEFYQIVILVIIAAVAVRISFKFDLNRYLENRRKIKMDKLSNICPHCNMELLDNNQIKVQSYFSSPIGTSKWICSRCHLVVESEDDVKRLMAHFTKNPELWIKEEKKFVKQMKKLGLV